MSLPVEIFRTWYISFIYLGFALGIAIFAFHYFITRSSIRHLRGPPSPSWFLGNIRELETSAVGDCEFRWANDYGSSYRLKGGYGEDVFVTSDPKALQFILQTSGYNIVKPPHFLHRATRLFGKSNISTTEGNTHKRHRKVMLPAFGFPETKALTHVFQSKASKLMSQWKVAMKGSNSFETNVHRWITRATLDAIGEGATSLVYVLLDQLKPLPAAFGYQFGTMDDHENKLGKTYQDMVVFLAAYPSKLNVAWRNFVTLLPRSLARLTILPTKSTKWAHTTRDITRAVGGKLLDEQWSISSPSNEEGKRDVMSLLVKANSTEDIRTRLTRMEVIDQMGVLIFAGHETTSNTLAWSLWELSKNHTIQDKLREEIMMYCQTYSDGVISVSEYDGMEYTVAFIKEVFRVHPIITKIERQAGKDLVVPLHDPIVDKDRKQVHEVLLKKGTRIFTNFVAYHRHPALWGSDPHTFRPERWLDMKESKVKFGVYGNLGIFGAGIHACIGWRFAVYELQSFIIAMMQNFKFDLPDKAPKIRRTFAGNMLPQVEGDEKHVRMPLKIIDLKN